MTTDPLIVFNEWLEEAKTKVPEPTAMAVATVDAAGRPAVRMVLLKQADERGFVFYTNTTSDKGQQLAHQACAELCFHWNPPGRQVRVHGNVEKVSDEEADTYFASRPYRSQLGAWASQQSRPLANQTTLIKAVAAQAIRFPHHVDRPPHWTGYRVVPQWIELWSGVNFRLHDRVRYTKESDGTWAKQRLFP